MGLRASDIAFFKGTDFQMALSSFKLLGCEDCPCCSFVGVPTAQLVSRLPGFADNAKKMPVKVKKQLDPTAELIRQLQEENAKLQAQLQSMGSEEIRRNKLGVTFSFYGFG